MVRNFSKKLDDSSASNWPMLVLRNDFAQQMGQKVCKEYMMRAYRNIHSLSGGPTLEQRVQDAKAKVDTGLIYSGSQPSLANQQGSHRPKTAMTGRNSIANAKLRKVKTPGRPLSAGKQRKAKKFKDSPPPLEDNLIVSQLRSRPAEKRSESNMQLA